MSRVVCIKFGSHLYGTDTPESDIDYKAVHLPSAEEILLQRVRASVSSRRDKREGEKNSVGEVDEESYSLQRYFELLVSGQTVAIDMLFAPSSCLLETSPLWFVIQSNRPRLLTKKSTAFVGYCRTQANKYGIKGSRVAAARDAMLFFKEHYDRLGATAKVFEVEALLPSLLGEHIAIVQQVVNRDGDIGTYIECCNRKVDFNATIKQGYEVFNRIHENYGARAKMAQRHEGVDWKALSHAVRVGQEALELLETGSITFPLANAQHILEIKKGRIPYQAVAEEIEGLLIAVEESSISSSLPDSADTDFIDSLVADVHKGIVMERA
jgi:RNA repair pathway DNA polymerase beta family